MTYVPRPTIGNTAARHRFDPNTPTTYVAVYADGSHGPERETREQAEHDYEERNQTMPRQEPPESTVKMIAHMYRMGYRQGMTELYRDNNHAKMRFGLKHYGKRGEMKDGAYERGIADALYDRLEA